MGQEVMVTSPSWYRNPQGMARVVKEGGWAAAVVLLIVSILVASGAEARAQASSEPAPLVRLPFPQDDGSLTPYTFERGYSLLTLVYDTLLWRDAQGVPQPWLARSVETSPDGRRLTVRLADGVRWHDGVPLTAADVVFTFGFVARHPHPRFTPELRALERVQAVDPLTVVMFLHHSSPGFLDQPLADLPILPAHVWQRLAPGLSTPEGLPVGSGPYRLVAHVKGKSYRFQANAGYFRGPPAVAALEVPVITEAEATVRSIRQRRVDMLPVSLPEQAAARVESLGTRVVEGPSYLGTVLMFNLRRAPFDRAEVRQAMAKALDLDRVVASAGDAVPADRGYLHPESTWAPTDVLHRFDEGAARRELGGLALPAIQVLAPDNDPLKLVASRQVAFALQRVGVNAESRPMRRDEMSRALGEGGAAPAFQAAIVTAPPLASYDPDFLLRLFGSDPKDGSLNYSGYRSRLFDDLAGRIATTSDLALRRMLVEKALRLLAADVPVVPLFFATGMYVYRPAIYDGWVFVKGSGILDKRSFVEGRMDRPAVPEQTTTEGEGFPFGAAALALLSAALVLGVVMGLVALRGRKA